MSWLMAQTVFPQNKTLYQSLSDFVQRSQRDYRNCLIVLIVLKSRMNTAFSLLCIYLWFSCARGTGYTGSACRAGSSICAGNACTRRTCGSRGSGSSCRTGCTCRSICAGNACTCGTRCACRSGRTGCADCSCRAGSAGRACGTGSSGRTGNSGGTYAAPSVLTRTFAAAAVPHVRLSGSAADVGYLYALAV